MADIMRFDDTGGYNSPSAFPVAYEDQIFMQSHTDVLVLDENRDCGPEIPDSALGGDDQYEGPGDFVEEEEEKELSPGGILDEETVGQGLSNLGRSADGTQQVYLHLTIPGFSLRDINLLGEFIHLQKVEMPYNEITDLSPLGNMPNLLELDASNNKITKLLDFTPPKNLKCVDLSFNLIEEMADLSAHHYLQKLCLDNNQITDIKGLEKCHRLSHLGLSHNSIEKIQGLNNLPLKHLNLRSNKLKKIENLETLKCLQFLDLSGNTIRSMDGLQRHDLLENIELESNEVIDITEISHIRELPMLRKLNLHKNPITELPDYRLSILFRLQRLTELDRQKVKVEEKVCSVNMFNPPLEVTAARDHIMHVVYSFLQPQRIYDSTLPSMETPYPLLILVGPQGSGKHDLAQKLVDEFSDYFGLGVSHTTRKMHPEEKDGRDYHFVTLEQFEEEVKRGSFVQVYQYSGEWYGLTMSAMESVAREGLACVSHMELEGVLTLKNTYFEPRYVLIMPLSREVHDKRLRDRGIYSDDQIENTLSRAKLYIEHNQEHPGFFDMMIGSDNISEAYKKLRKLVMDYLGVVIDAPEDSEIMDAESVHTGKNLTEPGLGARTWSRPSIPDSLSQIQANAAGMKSKSPTGRGVLEERSLSRRKSAAKEAVAGVVPGMYDDILKGSTKTAPPDLLADTMDMGDDTMMRSRSAPTELRQFTPSNPDNLDELPPSSPDSSNSGSRASTSISNISSAAAAQQDQNMLDEMASQEGSERGDPLGLPSEAMDPMELMSPDRNNSRAISAGQVHLGMSDIQPGSSGSRPGSGGSLGLGSYDVGSLPPTNKSGRPGSEKHRVLPPITSSPTRQMLPEY